MGATVTAQRDSQVPRRATGARPGRRPGLRAEGRGSNRGQRGSRYKGATGREHPLPGAQHSSYSAVGCGETSDPGLVLGTRAWGGRGWGGDTDVETGMGTWH